MITRAISARLKELAGQFLTVTIQGARQTGKTTLAKMVFPEYNYVNLEDTKELALAKADIESFFDNHPSPLIIDEVQLFPEILRTVQVRVDAHNMMGEYILTGSHQPLLRETICESLAGRTSIVELFPLSMDELSGAGISLTREEYLYRGFLPRLYNQANLSPTLAYEAYYQTYVERDVRLLMNFQLLDKGFLPVSVAKEDRLRYYTVLEEFAVDGNLAPFAEYVADLEVARLDELLEVC